MAQPDIRAIIFDIGRVLVRLDLRSIQTGLANGQSLDPAALWSAIEKDPRWHDWQEGRMSAAEWHQHLMTRFSLPLTLDQFTVIWNSTLHPEPIHANSLFDSLSRRYRLGLLSNTDPIHVARLESQYDFFRYFPPATRTYSCVVGCSKPDPQIFQEALRRCEVRPANAVYIDDIDAYVTAARSLGIHGIHFQSAAQLVEDFSRLGIQV